MLNTDDIMIYLLLFKDNVKAQDLSQEGEATIILFVGLHHTFRNFKVWQSEENKIK